MIKRNRKKIYLTSSPHPPELPEEVVEAEPEPPVPTVSIKLSFDQSVKVKSADINYLKAPRVIYKGHGLSVHCVAVYLTPNEDNSLIFSGGDDKTIKVWSLKTGDKVAELHGHTQRVTSISCFQSSGFAPLIVSGSWDERLRIWPMQELLGHCQEIHDRPETQPVCDGISERVSAQSICLRGHRNRVFGVKVIHSMGEDPVVASGSSDNTIRVWSLPDGTPLYVLEDERDDTWNLCLSSWFVTDRPHQPFHGTVIISGCKNSTVRVWRHKVGVKGGAAGRKTRTSPLLVMRGHTSAIHSLAPFEYQDKPFVVTACKDADVRVWSLLTGSLIKVLRGHVSPLTTVTAFSTAQGETLLVSSSHGEDAPLRVWKYSTGECLRFFKGHTQDINAVEVFSSPDARRDDLVIVSASKDTTVRSWLLADEKALKVLEHGESARIKSMDVFHSEVNSLVITGTADGALSAWRTKRDEVAEGERPYLEWTVERAHKNHVLALCVYRPLINCAENSSWPEHLQHALVISAARNGLIRISNIFDGSELTPPFIGHNKAVTSLCVFRGVTGCHRHSAIVPFFVSGSEDHTAKIWSLADFTCLRTLDRHIFDVTSVAVFLPRIHPAAVDMRRKRIMHAQRNVFGSAPLPPIEGETQPAGFDPIIITGGMDDTLHLWSYSSGKVIESLHDADSHITSLTCIQLDQSANSKFSGPVVIAGDGNGTIWVWALRAPFELICTLKGHTDEVRSVYVYDAEGIPPVLVSGSLDCTVKVWNLETMKLNKTMEGHTSDVTVVRVFNLGGSDLALVSASSDTTARIVFDFMEAAPQLDVVMQLFHFDVNGTNIHVTADSTSNFPRISALATKEGPEQFFGTYFVLFGEALRLGRPDFLEEFLPLSQLGLLKANRSDVVVASRSNDKIKTFFKDLASGSNDAGDENSTHNPTSPSPLTTSANGGGASPSRADFAACGLLRHALLKNDLRAVRCIVGCWCRFLSEASLDLIHDESYGRISMEDMLLLAQVAPGEFQRLVCSVRLIPAQNNYIPPCSYFLCHDIDKHTRLEMMPAADAALLKNKSSKNKNAVSPAVKTAEAVDPATLDRKYFYLPLSSVAHMDMIRAYTYVCDELDSVEIFNSEVGKLALAYAWRRFGLKAHLIKMAVYFFYVILSSVCLLEFERFLNTRHHIAAYVLICVQLAIDAFFIKEETQQCVVAPLEYFSDIWNVFDAVVIFTNITANVLRLVYMEDNTVIEVLLSVSVICAYFNILYYLRAFEATGPLVSMIMRISMDIKYLILVVFIILLGFSQAFWLVSRRVHNMPFSTFRGSLLNSYAFMLGGFDPSAFADSRLYSFAVALSCIYMLIVSILLLNLLIALMGDSYGAVREKGLAQWKLEQAQIVTEMQGSMSAEDRECADVLYFRRHVDEHEEDDASSADRAQLEATIGELKHNQALMMRMLREQSEANSALRDYIMKQQQQQHQQQGLS